MAEKNIIERIKAILRKADPARNPSEEERNAAMALAQKLLDKYDLDMAALGSIDENDHGFANEFFFARPRTEHWQGILITNIAEYYHCLFWVENDNNNEEQWRVLGRKHHTETLRLMGDWLIPQMEREFLSELGTLNKQAQYARLYGERALIENITLVEGEKAGFEIKYDLETGEVSAERIADAGWSRFLLLAEDVDPVEDIMNLCGISSYNYAKKVRPYIKKKEIAKISLENHQAASYKWNFYKGMIVTIRQRMEAMRKENLEEYGKKGQELITNETAALLRAMEEEGLNLSQRPDHKRDNDAAMDAGRSAGERVDLMTGSKVGMPQWKELEA